MDGISSKSKLDIRKNILYQALAQVGGRGLMFFVYMLLARFLGPALYGIFGYTLTTVQIISGVLFDVGLFLIVTRELSVGNDSIFLPSIWLKMAGCLLGSVLFLILVPILGLPFILGLSLVIWAVFNSFTDFYFCVFRAKDTMHAEAITMISQRIFLLGMVLLLYMGWIPLSSSSSLHASGVVFCCSALLGFLLALMLRRLLIPPFIYATGFTSMILKAKVLMEKALPLVGVSFFGFIYYKIDIVLLGILSSSEQVGFYTASYRIIEASFLIPIVITNALYPRLSLLWADDYKGFARVFRRTILALTLVSLLAGAGIIALSQQIIDILFGWEFLPSAGILCLLAGVLFMVYPGYMLIYSLVIMGRQRGYFYISLSAAVINILLNFFFIPIWQAKGAAAATIVTEAMVTGIASLIVMRQMNNRRHE
ncbi:MAG: oligosaccharide flippase family protein [Bacteroidales bacterium]|jgi:O-antigen/teichoic acid export membrane protein|nr:oligosaccharide flippase family protein [Bacteroidales bacterium]HPW37503.1 flippase [Syntrophorhabdus sp.]